MAQRKLAKAFLNSGRPSALTACQETRLRLAKWYAGQHNEGAHGMNGGWIYTAEGKPIVQGWFAYYYKRKQRIWQALEERAQ